MPFCYRICYFAKQEYIYYNYDFFMKPITNILLIATLICYVFLPLCELQVKGDVTGLAYSAAMITENFSFKRTIFALLPFIACFGGIAINCLKNRYWGLLVAAFVGMGVFFFNTHHVFLNVSLQHAPDVIANDALEGFGMEHLGVGYTVCRWLLFAALASALVSVLPFKFNTILERSIDETFEKGIQGGKKTLSKVGHDLHDEWNKIEHATYKSRKSQADKQPTAETGQPVADTEPAETAPTGDAESAEDPNARFMPPQQRESAEPAAPSDETPEENPYARFMPPQQEDEKL